MSENGIFHTEYSLCLPIFVICTAYVEHSNLTARIFNSRSTQNAGVLKKPENAYSGGLLARLLLQLDTSAQVITVTCNQIGKTAPDETNAWYGCPSDGSYLTC